MSKAISKLLFLFLGIVVVVILIAFYFVLSQGSDKPSDRVKDCVEQVNEEIGEDVVGVEFDCAISVSAGLYPTDPELAIELCKKYALLVESETPFVEQFCKSEIEKRIIVKPVIDINESEEYIEMIAYVNSEHGYSVEFPATYHFTEQDNLDSTLLGLTDFIETGVATAKGFDVISVNVFSRKGALYLEELNRVSSVEFEDNGKFYVVNYISNSDLVQTEEVFDGIVNSFKFL